ncbi:MAG: response regulator transcription factor [Caldimicrobium sp.]|jgi:DNA-binding response OmpR family regulator
MKKKILVVDDDPDILKIVSAFLELEAFQVFTAQSVQEAKKVFQRELPDLIILDIMLPDESGLNWLKDLKRIFPLIPVLLLTAKSSVSDKVIGFELGADDYLAKPFEPLELIARCKALLRKKEVYTKKETTLLRIKDLEIDFEKKRITKKGKEIPLTPKEWAILSLLASNPGKIFSREEIREVLWKDKEIYNWSRVLDVHIKHLRDKIEDDPSSPEYIITVYGQGYKFREI